MVNDTAAKRLFVRKLLSLPTPLLRLMAGGGVVYRGGRTLEPRLQFLAAQAKRMTSVMSMTPEEARRAEAEAIALMSGDPEPGVRWGPWPCQAPEARFSRAPIDRATRIQKRRCWSGRTWGAASSARWTPARWFCSILAGAIRCPVLSVDYRVAPEHRFPAGLEDVLAAYRWGRDKTGRFGAPEGVAAIGGDAIGGNFAAAVCQELKRAGEAQPVLQLLVYPCTDVTSESASMVTYADAFPLSRSMIDWYLGHYLGPDDDPADPRLSPLCEKDLTGLAPAIVVTAGFDPLVDQAEAYAKQLKAAGTPVAYRCYDSLTHGFTAYTGAVPCADVACREIAGLARDRLQGRLV